MKNGRNYRKVQMLCQVLVEVGRESAHLTAMKYCYYYAERVRVSSREPQFALIDSLSSTEEAMVGVAYCQSVGAVFLRLCENLMQCYSSDSKCEILVYNSLIYDLLKSRPFIKHNLINCCTNERLLYTER